MPSKRGGNNPTGINGYDTGYLKRPASKAAKRVMPMAVGEMPAAGLPPRRGATVVLPGTEDHFVKNQRPAPPQFVPTRASEDHLWREENEAGQWARKQEAREIRADRILDAAYSHDSARRAADEQADEGGGGSGSPIQLATKTFDNQPRLVKR